MEKAPQGSVTAGAPAGSNRRFFSSDRNFLIVGVLLFLLAFTLPVYLLLQNVPKGDVVQSADTGSESNIFADPFAVARTGDVIKVASDETLDPVPGKDFVLVTWFRLFHLPKPKEKLFLLTKYQESGKFPGYAIALVNEGDQVLPMVYWRNNLGEGRWYPFSPVNLETRSWFMLAVSFQNGEMLGLHFTTQSGKELLPVKTLGGYRLSLTELPKTDEPILSGAVGSNRLVGKIGLIGILSGPPIKGDLDKMLSELKADPTIPPQHFRGDGTKLWLLDGKPDSSPYAHETAYLRVSSGKLGRPNKRKAGS